jgi:hypothetical protein
MPSVSSAGKETEVPQAPSQNPKNPAQRITVTDDDGFVGKHTAISLAALAIILPPAIWGVVTITSINSRFEAHMDVSHPTSVPRTEFNLRIQEVDRRLSRIEGKLDVLVEKLK